VGTCAEGREYCYGEVGYEGVWVDSAGTVCHLSNLLLAIYMKLIVTFRLVSIARGEQQYFDPDGIPTATEGCKSNALMRCCKDLGIASELWDPRFIRKFHTDFTKEVWVEHATTKKKRKMVLRKDDQVKYPFKESKAGGF
jgi:hypothetical protein